MITDTILAKVMTSVGDGIGLEAALKAEDIEPTDAVMRWVKDNHKASYKTAREVRETKDYPVEPGDPIEPKGDKVMECKWVDRESKDDPKDGQREDVVNPEPQEDKSLILRIK